MRGGSTTAAPSAPPLTIPSTVTVQKEAQGPDWIQYRQTWHQPAYGPSMPQTVVTPQVWGPAITGGFWMDPAHMQALQPGPVLDTDPVTGARLSVTLKGPIPGNGRPALRLTETATRYTMEWLYDLQNGVLLASRLEQRLSALGSQTYWFELVRAE
jgi:hypothetical protein